MEYILVLLIVALLNGAIAYIDGLMEGIIPLTLYAEQYMSTLAGVDLFQSLFDIVFGFGVSLIVLKFLKKGFETYVLWSDGDADEEPIAILTNFFKAMAVAICFPTMYDWLATIVEEMSNKMLEAIGLATAYDWAGWVSGISSMGLVTAIFGLVFVIVYFILYFQFLMRGLIQDEEKSKLTSLSRYCNYDEEQKQLTIEQEYRSITPQDQYMLNLFEQTITIHMTPVPEYSSLKEIGTPVTHNGRTWVFQGTWEDDETFRLHAWGTSGDIWQMGRPMKEPVTPEEVKMDDFIQWKQSGIEESSSFEATVKVSEDTEYELKIPGISLVADLGDNGPIVEVPIPTADGTEEVDVSFSVGKDTYHIEKVERRKKESQSMLMKTI